MKMDVLVQQFCRRDLVFRFLSGKPWLEPAKIAVGVAILTFMVLWKELSLVGTPFEQKVLIVSFQSLLIFPLAVILYFAVPYFLAQPFTVLEKSDSVFENVVHSAESYSTFRERMISAMDSFVWIFLALLMVVYYWYYRLFTPVPSDPSESLPAEIRVWFRIALLLIYSPLLYMGMLTLARIFVGSIFIGFFLRSFKIEINPLNPDGIGGLGFVGQMLITSALIATAIGGAAAGLVYVNLAAGKNPLGRVEIIILGLLYLILTPLLFHSLMWSPHQAMLRAREEALKPLADEYLYVSSEAMRRGKKNIEAIKSKTDHLIEIKRQYELVRDSFPLWPLNTSSLRNLLATSVLPAISTLFSGFISGLWNTLTEFLKISKP